ncbi:MAG: ATP-binding protein [Acidobacteriota bacterium]
MESDQLDRLTAQSTLAELPSYRESLGLTVRGQVLGDLLKNQPSLPGVVITDMGIVRGVISRNQYLRLVGRYLGLEVYHPRPLRLMFEATEAEGEPLVVPMDLTVPAALQQALQRPTGLVYEPLIVQEDARGERLRLIDFQDLLLADARISTLRNEQMSQILSTVQEGFLLVDRDGIIASEYSKSIETIFGTDRVASRDFGDLLADVLPEERAQLGRGYLDTLFNPNVIEKLVYSINPLVQTQGLVDGEERHLAFRFARSLEGERIQRVMVRVEDVTREIALAAELEAQEHRARERVNLVFDILRADPGQLADLLARVEQEIRRGDSLVNGLSGREVASARTFVEHQEFEPLLRNLHGAKGEAGLIGLNLFQDQIHELEQRLVDISERSTLDLAGLRVDLEALNELVAQTRSVIDQFRQLGHLTSGHAERAAATGPETVDRPVEADKAEPAAPSGNLPAAPSGTAAPAPTQTMAGNGRPAAAPDLFDQIARLVADLSDRHGKPARFVSRNKAEDLPAAYRDLARELLIQFVRNSIVHGLESLEARQQLGKPLVGTLQFAVRRHREHQMLELIYQDDGRGLDLDRIRQRARERGLEVPEDPEQIMMLIFQSGFSTAETTTLDAGRGVGMDLVRAKIEQAGGSLLPHSQPGVFCAFQIVLPDPTS